MTELPAEPGESGGRQGEGEDKGRDEEGKKSKMSQNYIDIENEIKKENEKNLTKWK